MDMNDDRDRIGDKFHILFECQNMTPVQYNI